MPTVNYTDLLIQTKPKPIRSELEKKHFLTMVDKLMSIDESDLTQEEADMLELLALIIEDYEKKHCPLPVKANPNYILKELMENNDLEPKDLLDIFDSNETVREVINNKRSISKKEAIALGLRFKVSPALFIERFQ